MHTCAASFRIGYVIFCDNRIGYVRRCMYNYPIQTIVYCTICFQSTPNSMYNTSSLNICRFDFFISILIIRLILKNYKKVNIYLNYIM
jgi:hypothetical protein